MILNGLPWKQTEIILSFLRLHPSTAFRTLVDHDGYSISSKGFLHAVVPHLNLMNLAKILSPNEATFTDTGGQDFNISFEGTEFNP